MRRYSKKGLEKRKAERADYPEFFKRHISIIKSNRLTCQECGEKLKGSSSEVAHILPKSYFKSVATNDNNVVYLCGPYSVNNCHGNFDNFNIKKFKEMFVFSLISDRFAQLQEVITEKIPYKIYDKYTKE